MDDIRHQLDIVTREKQELLKVNHRWDDQYRQLEAMYKRLQQDNLRMQQEMEATIYNLKARVSELEQTNENFSSLNHFQGKSDYSQSHYDDLNKEVVALQELHSQCEAEKDRLNSQITLLKHKLTEMQAADKTSQQYKEDNEMLRQQISTYKEDFDKERADRERLVSEKNAMKLKHDSEMSTMHIKLDKLQRDLNYYTSTNVKLQQQLKLRSSQDSESYHSYLSTKGYNDATTPPMDPYVERDEEDDLHFPGDIRSCPALLVDCSRNGSGRQMIANGQPRSIQNIVVARDPGNRKTAEETKSYVSRLHLPFTSRDHKHKTCSRCGRKFTDKVEYQDHITKCIQ